MCTMICDMMIQNVKVKRAMGGALVIVSALLASGCVQPKPEKDDVQMATSPEQARSAPTQPAVRQPEPEPEKPAKHAANAAQAEQPAPADEVVYSAAELVGKSQTEVTALIGAPARVEQRAASTVWTYRSDACGLDVFFFLDMATSDERVLTVESTTDIATGAGAAAGTTATPDATAADGAAGQATSAPAEGSAVDACYGKLRRS